MCKYFFIIFELIFKTFQFDHSSACIMYYYLKQLAINLKLLKTTTGIIYIEV